MEINQDKNDFVTSNKNVERLGVVLRRKQATARGKSQLGFVWNAFHEVVSLPEANFIFMGTTMATVGSYCCNLCGAFVPSKSAPHTLKYHLSTAHNNLSQWVLAGMPPAEVPPPRAPAPAPAPAPADWYFNYSECVVWSTIWTKIVSVRTVVSH